MKNSQFYIKNHIFMENNENQVILDKLIFANNFTDRTRASLTPGQSSRLIQIIAEIELEKGSPPVWHQVSKNMFENNYLEFQS